MLRCSSCSAEVSRISDKCACGQPTVLAVDVCLGCGEKTSRVRTIYDRHGAFSREECDMCAPNSFDPQWKTARGAMGWEAYPNQYTKRVMPDGSTGYFAKDELRADTEAKIAKPAADDVAAYEKAKEEKAAHRRTTPLTRGEIESRINQFRKSQEVTVH